jgi:hypothetical protein
MSAPAASSSTPLPQSSVHHTHRSSVAFAPVLLWLALQGLALVAAGLRVPFSARFPVPAEQMALHEMLVVQMVGSALLFPMLFRTFATGVLLIAGTMIMTQLAGMLASTERESTLIAVCTYPTLWLAGLGLWAYALRTTRARMYGVATAILVVIGGVLVAYLQREFGAPIQPFDWSKHGYLGPLMGGITLVEAGEWTGKIWVFLGFHLLLSIIAAGWRWRRSRQTPILP